MNKVNLLSCIVIMGVWSVAFPMNRKDTDCLNEPGFHVNDIELPILFPETSGVFLPDRIIINQHTGQIIAGSAVPIRELEINYREIQIWIRAKPSGDGAGHGSQFHRSDMITVGQIVSTLLDLAVHPAEIIDILRLFKQEGALRAELEIW
ncbi:MAG TPA: flagellar basal body P-ring protein FlgI [bacterium]|nr:flagellar basal body P-ring protein FlgI [bacterium]